MLFLKRKAIVRLHWAIIARKGATCSAALPNGMSPAGWLSHRILNLQDDHFRLLSSTQGADTLVMTYVGDMKPWLQMALRVHAATFTLHML